MTDELYNKIVCALLHNINVCDDCKKCGENGADVRVKLVEELAKSVHKNVPWTFSTDLSQKDIEINYIWTDKKFLIDEGIIKNHKYQIWWIYGWPTAYVLPLQSLTLEQINKCPCHGGITSYYSPFIPEKRVDLTPYIGWDYCHNGDYRCSFDDYLQEYEIGNKKWTYEEIMSDINNVIDYLEKIYQQNDEESIN